MRWRHIPALDGLRGLAVLAVMAVHLFPKQARGGFLGVDIFFVLSGFLITGLLITEVGTTGRLARGRFYLRRALRLYPALLAVILLAVVLTATTGTNDGQTSIWATVPLVGLYVGNWWNALAGQGLGWLAHTWSLAIEEQFYLVWPFVIVWLLRRVRPERLVALLIAGAAASRGLLYVIHGSDGLADVPFFRADALMLGALVALLVHDGGRRRAPDVLVAFAATGLVVAALRAREGTGYLLLGGLTIVAGAAAVLIYALATAPSGWLRRPLEWAPLRLVGRVSYGLYLYHYPIIRVVDRYGPHTGRLILEVALSAAATGLSWRFVEQPFLRRKDRLGASAQALEHVPGPADISHEP